MSVLSDVLARYEFIGRLLDCMLVMLSLMTVSLYYPSLKNQVSMAIWIFNLSSIAFTAVSPNAVVLLDLDLARFVARVLYFILLVILCSIITPMAIVERVTLVCRFGRWLYLPLQCVIFCDVAHAVNDAILSNKCMDKYYYLYILCCIIANGVCIIVLHRNFYLENLTSESLGLINITMCAGLLLTILSILKYVSKGMILPLTIFIYCIYLCYGNIVLSLAIPTTFMYAEMVVTTIALSYLAVYHKLIISRTFNPLKKLLLQTATTIYYGARFSLEIDDDTLSHLELDPLLNRSVNENSSEINNSGTPSDNVLYRVVLIFASMSIPRKDFYSTSNDFIPQILIYLFYLSTLFQAYISHVKSMSKRENNAVIEYTKVCEKL